MNRTSNLSDHDLLITVAYGVERTEATLRAALETRVGAAEPDGERAREVGDRDEGGDLCVKFGACVVSD